MKPLPPCFAGSLPHGEREGVDEHSLLVLPFGEDPCEVRNERSKEVGSYENTFMRYDINEFAVESDFLLPCDPAGRSPRAIPDTDRLTIRRGSLAHISCTMRKLRPKLIYDVGDGFLLEPMTTRGMLALHIDFRGQTLTVGCPDDRLEIASAWAIHAGLGVATLTHGGVPLHGAGFQVAGQYIALMADSGAGKSTLSGFLPEQGARFGNDDLVPVRMGGDAALAFPAVSLYPKLSREAVDQRGLDCAAQTPADYGTGEEEYYVPLPPARRVCAPQPLAAVSLLQPSPLLTGGLRSVPRMPETVSAKRLLEDDAAATLRRNLRTAWLIEKWMDGRKLDTLCRRRAACVPCWSLSYPKAFALLPEVARMIGQRLEQP